MLCKTINKFKKYSSLKQKKLYNQLNKTLLEKHRGEPLLNNSLDMNTTYTQNPKNITNPKHFNLLCMLYITMLLSAVVMAMYIAKIGILTFNEGAAIIPFMYFFGDIIAEVYGYERSRKLIWNALVCEAFFLCIIIGMVHLPSPKYWHHQHEFRVVLAPLYRVLLSNLILIPLTEFANVIALSKLKILTRGKLFWLRSLLSSITGELILAVLGNIITFWKVLAPIQLAGVILSSFGIKLIFTAAAIIPATIIVKQLKKSEKLDIYDYNTSFNPFKLNNQ